MASRAEYAPVATEFNEVFGGEHPSPSWHWLLPLKVKFPEWAMDNIMGYEWNPETMPAVAYREPADTDGDASSTASGVSSLGGRLSEGGGGGGGGGGGTP